MKTLLVIPFLIFSLNAISQDTGTVSVSEETVDSKIKTIGKTKDGLREGKWVEYYKSDWYEPAKDTLYASRGRYINGKRIGTWEFYGLPRIVQENNKNYYYPHLDSVVFFEDGTETKTYYFDFYAHLSTRIEKNDSVITKTTYWENEIRWDKDFRDDTLRRAIIIKHLKKNLTIQRYFENDGRPINEWFSNDHFSNVISKDFTMAFNYERDSYGPNYTILTTNKNGTKIMERDFVNKQLFNVRQFDVHGKPIYIGDFKNGNGVFYTRKFEKTEAGYFYGNIEGAEIYVNSILTENHRGLKEPALSWKKGDPSADYVKLLYHPNGKTFMSERYKEGRLFGVYYYDAEYNSLNTGSFNQGNGWLKRYKLGSVTPYAEELYENGILKQKRSMKK